MKRHVPQLFLWALAVGCYVPTSSQAAPASCRVLQESYLKGTSPELDCVLKPLVVLEDMFSEPLKPGENMIDRITTSSEARKQIQRLQRIGELFADELDGGAAKAMKALDAFSSKLGAYGDGEQFLDFARKSLGESLSGKGPLEADDAGKVIVELQKQRADARADLNRFLAEEGWLDANTSPLGQIAKRLKKIDWQGGKATRKEVGKALRDKLQEVLDADYDFNDLEKGTHRFRKDLREILVSVQSTYGVVLLIDGQRPLTPTEQAVATSKYATMTPNTRVGSPIVLTRADYLDIVAEEKTMGAIKDFGQGAEALAHALDTTGVASRKKADQLALTLAATNPDFAPYADQIGDIKGTSKAVAKRVRADDGPLQRLAKQIKRQL